MNGHEAVFEPKQNINKVRVSESKNFFLRVYPLNLRLEVWDIWGRNILVQGS